MPLLAEVREEPIRKVWGVRDAELLDGLLVDASILHVQGGRFPFRRAAKGLPEVEVGDVLRGEKALLALALGRGLSPGQLDARALGQRLERLALVDPVHLHQPVEAIALLAAAPAMKRAAVGIDAE